MRNSRTRNLIGSLLAATIAVCMATSTMPEIRCKTGNCVKASGQTCFDGTNFNFGYKFTLDYDA